MVSSPEPEAFRFGSLAAVPRDSAASKPSGAEGHLHPRVMQFQYLFDVSSSLVAAVASENNSLCGNNW